MDYKFNIKKYVKFLLAANIILNNSIFARCCKKSDKGSNNKGYSGKGNKNKGYSGKGNKSTETNTTSNEKTKKEEQPDKEIPDNSEEQKKDYGEIKTELLEQLDIIGKNYNYLPEKNIDFKKEDLKNEINDIDSDEKAKCIKIKLNSLSIDLNNNLENLRLEYLRNFNNIKNGNKLLGLGINTDLKEENIKNLKFEDINNIKIKLNDLYSKYTENLNNEAKKLEKEYDELKAKTKKLDNDTKKFVNPLLTLEPKDFQNITDYNKIQSIQDKINTIKIGISKGINGIKTEFQEKYRKNKYINDELKLNITEIDENLKNGIDSLSGENIDSVTNSLNNIDIKIDDGIKQTQEILKNEYKAIIEKITIYKSYNYEYIYTTINIIIKKDKVVEDYKEIKDAIKTLKDSFNNKLSELETKFQEKITEINKKLEGLYLSSDKIDLNGDNDILKNLTCDKLTDETIPDIENAIKKAENKYKETITNYKKECTDRLEQVETDCKKNDIFNKFSNDINTITNGINSIKTTKDKNDVDILISNLEKEIENTKKKKAEEEERKKVEENKEEKKIEEKKVEENKEEKKIEEKKVEENKEEKKIEEIKVEENKEEKKIEEIKVEENKEEKKIEEIKVEENKEEKKKKKKKKKKRKKKKKK